MYERHSRLGTPGQLRQQIRAGSERTLHRWLLSQRKTLGKALHQQVGLRQYLTTEPVESGKRMLPRVAVLNADPVSLPQQRMADSARKTEMKTGAAPLPVLRQEEKQEQLEKRLPLLDLR